MPKNTYYHYDHEACTFVEVKPTASRYLKHAAAVLVAALVISSGATWYLWSTAQTPLEISQQEEIERLRSQLATTTDQVVSFTEQMDALEAKDRDLYRALLGAEPISDDVRQVGIGGARDESFDRYSLPTSRILRENVETFDELERQIALQSQSFEDLLALAERHKERLGQTPAMLPTQGRLTSGFGMRRHPFFRARKMHNGVDFSVPTGTPIYATADGVISFRGVSGGYGNLVKIRHAKSNRETRYAHLSRFAPGIREGASVKRGDLIAYSGNTGLSTAPHLHYEVRDLSGDPLNPVTTFAPGVTPQEYQDLVEQAAEDNPMLGGS
ncbi:MAG: M23 family metallopeptidase [Bacteroidota bacterium]